MAYFLVWIADFTLLALAGTFLSRRVCAILAITACFLLAFLRGNVGSDLINIYLPMIRSPFNSVGEEPIFLLLLVGLKAIFKEPILGLTMGLSVCWYAVMLVYLSRAKASELFLVQAFLIPQVVVEQTINTLRLGLAFAFLLLMTNFLIRKRYRLAGFVALLALLTHFSCLIFIALLFAMLVDFKSRRGVGLAAIACLASVGFYMFYESYFSYKTAAYEHYAPPSALSGISSICTIFVILIGVWVGSLDTRVKLRISLVSGIAGSAFFAVRTYSYAGLRMLDIAVLAVPYATAIAYSQAGLRFGPRLKTCITITGLLGVFFTYRYLFNADPGPGNPVPYRFFWDYR